MATSSSIIERRLKDIRELLDKSFFTSAGFQINKVPTEADAILFISFRENPDFTFKLFYRHGTFSIDQSPGRNILLLETHKVTDYSEILDFIQDWTLAIKEECITVNALQRELEAFRIEFSQRVDEHIKDGDSHFTEEEREQLNEMFHQIRERLETLEKDKKIKEDELFRMQEVIDDLKEASYSMKKRSWWRVTGNKLFVTGNKFVSSPIGKILVEGIKTKYLP